MFKLKNKKQLLTSILLLGAICLFATACGNTTPTPAPVEPKASVAERLNAQDFTKMAENKLEYVGDNSGTGAILGLSLLSEYNSQGFEMETANKPFTVKVAYTIPKDDPNNYTEAEIETMANMTAMNLFVLINNVDEVEINLSYAFGDGEKTNTMLFGRSTFDEMCGVDVRSLADDPGLWSKAVAAYVAEHIPAV